MSKENDWRLTNQLSYLKGVELSWRQYSPSNPANDHDHCEFCWAKFMAMAGESILKEGYSTTNGDRWVCPECFTDFKELFGWCVNSPYKMGSE